MSKLSAIVAGVAVLPVLAFSGSASAVEAYGSIGGGNIVTSKNVTTNTNFADVTNATCNNIVKARVYIHNAGPNALTGVRVQAELPTGKASSFSVKMTASADNSNPKSQSDTTTIKSDKEATLNYVSGSAEYFDAQGGRLGSINDSIVTTGADVPGGVGVSTETARYVQIQAKLNCDDKPETPKEIKVCDLETKTVVTIKESDFNSTKHTKDLSKCNATPATPVTPGTTELTKTGPTSSVAVFAAVAAVAALAYNVVLRRQNAR